MNATQQVARLFLLAAALTAECIIVGRETKEPILDVTTPHGEVDVERDQGDGSITVNVGE